MNKISLLLALVIIFIGVITSLYSFVQRFTPSARVEINTKEDDYYRSHGAIVDSAEMSTLGLKITRTSSIMAFQTRSQLLSS